MTLELIDWAAVFTLAVVLKRKVAITRTSGSLGSWDCYPFLYAIAVGPAGVGKTTAIRYSFDLLDQIPNIGKPPTFVTIEGIVDDLIKAPDSSVFLTIEEFSDIMMKDHHGKMFEFLNGIYDGKVNLRQKTMARDLEFADKPCLNMFAGTTPEWVASNIPLTTINGGFGSRVIWIHVPGLRRRRMYYRQEMKDTDFLQIEKNLVSDLAHIALTMEGEYTIADDAMDFMEHWNENLPNTIKYKKISGYIMRKPVFAHKLAILMHVAYSDEMVLNLLDFKNAIAMLDALEPNLPKIFEGSGKNEYAVEMRDIAKYIGESGGVLEDELREIFIGAAGPAKLSELIDGLLIASIIRSELDEGNKRKFFLCE